MSIVRNHRAFGISKLIIRRRLVFNKVEQVDREVVKQKDDISRFKTSDYIEDLIE